MESWYQIDSHNMDYRLKEVKSRISKLDIKGEEAQLLKEEREELPTIS